MLVLPSEPSRLGLSGAELVHEAEGIENRQFTPRPKDFPSPMKAIGEKEFIDNLRISQIVAQNSEFMIVVISLRSLPISMIFRFLFLTARIFARP